MDLAHPTLTLREGGRLQQPAQQNASVLGKVSARAQLGVWDPEGVNYHLLSLSSATCSVMPEKSGPGALTGTVPVKRSAERIPAYIALSHRLSLMTVPVEYFCSEPTGTVYILLPMILKTAPRSRVTITAS